MKSSRGWPTPTEGPSEPSPADEARKSAMFKRAMMYADQLGLTDEMRYDLAGMIPTFKDGDDTSWKSLNEKQLHDLLCMLDGYVYITFLKENESG